MVYSLDTVNKYDEVFKLYKDVEKILSEMNLLEYVCTGAENPVPGEVNHILRNLGYDSREHYSYNLKGEKCNIDITVFDESKDAICHLEFKHYSGNQSGYITSNLLSESKKDSLKPRDIPMITVSLYTILRNDDKEMFDGIDQTFPHGCLATKGSYRGKNLTSDSEEYQNDKIYAPAKEWFDSFRGKDNPFLMDPIISDMKKFEEVTLPKSRNGKKPVVGGYVHYVLMLWK